MANTKISALPANNNPTGNEELVYALNNANGKMTLDTMKTFANTGQQAALVSGVNIKTINNTSILGSGNLDVSGGGGGSWQPTELSGDANIWELSEGIYVTDYDLYFKTGEKVPAAGSLSQRRQMLFVAEETGGEKGFFVYSVSSSDSGYASYGYSKSSSIGRCYQLGRREWTFNQYGAALDSGNARPEQLADDTIVQILDGIDNNDTNEISISSTRPPYPGVTYTIFVNSVAAAYTITLGTGVTNPFNVSLPTNSNKKCIITLLITSTTTAIVTGCTIEN